jgi:hypothetical protein
MTRPWLSILVLALTVCATSAGGCKSAGPSEPSDDGEGGEGGEGGGAGAGSGGAGMAGAGGPGGGGSGGMPPVTVDCMNVVRETARPAAVAASDGEASAQLPVKVAFSAASDLSGKFAVKGEAAHVSEKGGAVKVAAGKRAVLTYDTQPDETPTDTFGAFTATVTFRSERPVALWFGFATDKNRNDGEVIRFAVNKQRHGPAGVSDVDTFWFYDGCLVADLGVQGKETCFSEPLCGGARSEAYAWTHFDPSIEPQKVKVTVVPDKAAKTIRAWAEFIDKDGVVVDGALREWVNVPHSVGELSFGMAADLQADAFIDEIEVKAAEAIPNTGVVTVEDAPIHIWIPENYADKPVKGILITDPALLVGPGASGDMAMFGHLRRFSRAWGWALVGGVRSAKEEFKTYFQADMAKLVTKTGRQELNTVPVFIHSLLDTLSYQALSDETFNKRVIGFMADKPRGSGDPNIQDPTSPDASEGLSLYPMGESGRKIPGFIVYTATVVSRVADRRTAVIESMWSSNRFHPYLTDPTTTEVTGAYWAMTVHGIQTHAVVDSWALYLAHLQELISKRTNGNDGKLPLKAVSGADGHLGTSPFFVPVNMGTISQLAPFQKFPPPPAAILDIQTKPQSDFIYGKSTALVWQAFDYYKQTNGGDGPVIVGNIRYSPKEVWWKENPKHGKAGESRKLPLAFAPSLQGWSKIEFFDSASPQPMTPLATVMPGQPAEYTYTNLAVGAHNFVAHVTAGDGKVHATFPVMAIMEP